MLDVDYAMTSTPNTIRIECPSHVDMLDVIQILSDHVGRLGGLDEDSGHWVGVAIQEAAANAVKHGNQEDQAKRVTVEFTLEPLTNPTKMTVRICDEGEGFDPVEVDDPLAPENLLKESGRGILFMRNFMDEVDLKRIPGGGMEVRLVKKLGSSE